MSIIKRFRAHKTAGWLSFLYFLPAMAWVIYSDRLIFKTSEFTRADQPVLYQDMKDLIVVFVSTGLIFIMVTIAGKKMMLTRRNYESMFYHHPNPMWIYEIETLKFLEVNDAAVRLYGYSRKEFLNMYSRDIRPPEEEMKVYRFVIGMKKGVPNTHSWKHLKKNGDVMMVEAVSNEVLFDKKRCYLISIKDMTDRNLREETLKKLSLVAQHSTTSMIILDRMGVIEWVNQPFTLLTGYSLEESVGKRPQAFLHGPETDPATRQLTTECVTQGKSFFGEIVNYHKNGTPFWLTLSISPVIEDGKVVNFVTVQTDISQIKQQNRNLRDIAFATSHQFRKPLANILGLVNEIQHEYPGMPQLDNLKQSACELDQELLKIVHKTSLILKDKPANSLLTHLPLPVLPEIVL